MRMPVVTHWKENMEFVKREHPHPLVLNECYLGNEGDVCYLCKEEMLPSPLAQSIYHCDNILVHKSCAELPLIITNYSMHPYHPLTGCTSETGSYNSQCTVCSNFCMGRLVYVCRPCDMMVCLKCVTAPVVYHPSHNQHPLVLVQRPATFRCDACGQETGDLASCKCTICFFWIHKSCACLSSSFQSKFHKHPLLLAYYLPQQYLQFRSKYCKICKKVIEPTQWLYYCAGCRIFVHIMCANATPQIRSSGESGNLVHLPAQDESSLNMLRQKLIHRMKLNQGYNASRWSFSPELFVIAAYIAEPEIKGTYHWSHQHVLILKNKCSTPPNIQIITVKDNNEDSADDDISIICDGCTNSINSSNTSYYECHRCQYFLHRYCAELPEYIYPYWYEPYTESHRYISFTKISSSNLFHCNGCNHLKSGIHLATENGSYKLDIGCAMLPKKIKHEAHEHPLTHAAAYNLEPYCDACFLKAGTKCELLYSCKVCDSYNLHTHCALRPRKLKHRWDPHPLTLITPEDIIEDHPHDFNCELCSNDIDTNYWFYHCNLCDLSCHMSCIYRFYRYSNINFSSWGTKVDQQLHRKLHEHGLKLVFIKKKLRCVYCHNQLFYEPILQCTTCNFIICLSCVDADQFGSADQVGLYLRG